VLLLIVVVRQSVPVAPEQEPMDVGGCAGTRDSC